MNWLKRIFGRKGQSSLSENERRKIYKEYESALTEALVEAMAHGRNAGSVQEYAFEKAANSISRKRGLLADEMLAIITEGSEKWSAFR